MWILNKNKIYRKSINIGVIGGTQHKTRWGYVKKDKYEKQRLFGLILWALRDMEYKEMHWKYIVLSLHRKTKIYWKISS